MTVPDERARAVRHAREFLYSLLDPKMMPRIPRPVRKQAGMILRHFPSDLDIDLVHEKMPDIFGKSDDPKTV